MPTLPRTNGYKRITAIPDLHPTDCISFRLRIPLILVADALLQQQINVTDTAGLIRRRAPWGQRRRHVIGRDVSRANQLDDANKCPACSRGLWRQIKTRSANDDDTD